MKIPLRSLALVLVSAPLLLSAAPVQRPDQAPGTPDQVEAGKASFAMCVGCHGLDGEGKVGVAPRLNSKNYLAVAPNDFFSRTIQAGREGTNMISWSAALGDEGIANVVAYIRSWQSLDGVVLDDSPLGGDLDTGQTLWVDVCSHCHGRSGAGYSEAGSGTGIGRADFLDVASNGFLRAVIKLGKDNTPMRSFSDDSPVAVANFTDDQIDSVIKYLRANAW